MEHFLLVNIGNTTTTFGIDVEALHCVPTAALTAGDLPSSLFSAFPRHWLVASVVPSANARLVELAGTRAATLFWLDCQLLSGIDCSAVDMTTVGADRIANLAATVTLLPLPAIVVDCGTAITTEVVDQSARFLGGAILPGRQMARRALRHFTGQLPEAEMTSEPPAAVGETTELAIRAGIDLGLLGTVEHLVRSTIATAALQNCTVVATGGDADFFVANCSFLQPAPDNFTMRGIAEIARKINLGVVRKAKDANRARGGQVGRE